MMKLGAVLFIALTFLSFSPAMRAGQLPLPGSGQSFRDCPECPEMVIVPAGRFMMGSPKSDLQTMAQELPQHKVTFSKPFAVGKFAVKFEEWDACLADGGCGGYKPDDEGKGRGNWPAVNVSWNDAKAYIAWLSKKTGKPYRLLSDAEWEYVARAGSASITFPDELYDDHTLDDPAKGFVVPAKPNAWGLRNIYGRPVWLHANPIADARHRGHMRATGRGRGGTRAAAPGYFQNAAAARPITKENHMMALTFTKKEAPEWLLAFWKEIDDKTFGKGFDCFAEDAICRLGVAVWNGHEAIRENLRAFIDTGFTAHHDVVEYWDGGSLKVFRGIVTMTPDDRSKPIVKPVMTHFFYMDEKEPAKVRAWFGSVGPVAF